MAIGLNTEKDPRKHKKNNYSQFHNLTLASGSVRPRNSDEAFTPEVDSLLEWILARVDDYSIDSVFDALTDTTYQITAPYAGGDAKIYNAPTDTTGEDIAFEPGAQPWNYPFRLGLNIETGEIGPGGVDDYGAIRDADAVDYFQSNYSDTLEEFYSEMGEKYSFKNTYTTFKQGNIGGEPDWDDWLKWPKLDGSKIENTTKSEFATIVGFHYFYNSVAEYYELYLIVDDEDPLKTSAWEATDAITYQLNDDTTPSRIIDENEVNRNIVPNFRVPYAFVTPSPKVAILRYDDISGVYRVVSDSEPLPDAIPPAEYIIDEYMEDIYYNSFPYQSSDQTALLKEWPGPVNEFGWPDELVHDFSNAQAVVEHKDSTMIAVGEIVYFSEPTLHRYFRETSKLRFEGKVLKMVSKGEICEVYTLEGVYYTSGDSPNFLRRKLQIPNGVVAPKAVSATDRATWGLGIDGINAYAEGVDTRRNLTRGNNTPWIDAIAAPEDAVLGVSPGRVFLADATGRVLGYDYEYGEFFSKTFAKTPTAFYYDRASDQLIVKFSDDSYNTIETGTVALSWIIQLPTISSGGRSIRLPGAMVLDSEGTLAVRVYIDDNFTSAIPLIGTGPRGAERIRLPIGRGGAWYATISGEAGAKDDTVVRDVSYG